MLRNVLLTLGCLLLVLGLSAQHDMPVVVVKATGKAKYYPPQGKKQKLQGGTTVDPNGMIRVCPKGMVKIYYDGSFHTFDEKGKYQLSETLEASSGGGELGFGSTFGDYLMAAASGGGGDGGDKTGGGGGGDSGIGWGNLEFAVKIPFGNKISNPDVIFIWRSKEDAKSYELQIMEKDGDDVLFRKASQDTLLKANLNDLGLSRGNSYTALVMAELSNGKSVNSTAYNFDYLQDGVTMKIEEGLQKLKEYQSADEVNKLLMKAVLLEEQKLFQDARQTYVMAVKNHPDDVMAQKMYKTFLAKYGWEEFEK